MTIALKTTAKLTGGFSMKPQKDGDHGKTRDVCRLKFAELFLTRDQVDEVARQRPDWHKCLFDDLGAPIGRLEIALVETSFTVTGTIAGTDGEGTLKLLEADLTKVKVAPTVLGAVLSGVLSWTARGDEVEDLAGLLGQLVDCAWRLTGSEQQCDLLRDAPAAAPPSKAAEAAAEKVGRVRRLAGGRDRLTL